MCYVVTFSPLKRERLTVLEHHCVSIVSVSVLSGTGLQPPRFGIRNCIFWLVSSGSGERRKEASLDHDLTAFTCGAVLGPVKTTLNSFNTRPGLTKRTNVVDGVTHFTALPHNGHPSGVALEDSGCS